MPKTSFNQFQSDLTGRIIGGFRPDMTLGEIDEMFDLSISALVTSSGGAAKVLHDYPELRDEPLDVPSMDTVGTVGDLLEAATSRALRSLLDPLKFSLLLKSFERGVLPEVTEIVGFSAVVQRAVFSNAAADEDAEIVANRLSEDGFADGVLQIVVERASRLAVRVLSDETDLLDDLGGAEYFHSVAIRAAKLAEMMQIDHARFNERVMAEFRSSDFAPMVMTRGNPR